MHRNIVIRQRLRGFTMMEMVLVIAAGLGLLVGGVVLYRQAEMSRLVAEKVRTFAAISAEIRQLYREDASYTGLIDTPVIQAKSTLPASMFQNMFVTRLGGNGGFLIRLSYLDQKVCQRIAANADGLGSNIAGVSCYMGRSTGYSIDVRYGH